MIFLFLLNKIIVTIDFSLIVYNSCKYRSKSHKKLIQKENALYNPITDFMNIIGESENSTINGSLKNKKSNYIRYTRIRLRTLQYPTSRFSQVSGLKLRIISMINKNFEVNEIEIFVGIRKIYNAKMNREKIDNKESIYYIYTIHKLID